MHVKDDRYIYIDTDLGLDYQDIPPWRSFQLITYGHTYTQLVDNAMIAEVDQDGGDIRSYALVSDQGDDDAKDLALRVIRSKVSS